MGHDTKSRATLLAEVRGAPNPHQALAAAVRGKPWPPALQADLAAALRTHGAHDGDIADLCGDATATVNGAATQVQTRPERRETVTKDGTACVKWRFDNFSGGHIDSVRTVGKDIFREPTGVKGPFKPLYHKYLDLTYPIVVCEGEKATDAVCESGHQATCWPGGANAMDAIKDCAEWLDSEGAVGFVLWADNDDPGRKAMERFAESCAAPCVTIMHGDEKDDAADLPIERRRDLLDSAIDELAGVANNGSQMEGDEEPQTDSAEEPTLQDVKTVKELAGLMARRYGQPMPTSGHWHDVYKAIGAIERRSVQDGNHIDAAKLKALIMSDDVRMRDAAELATAISDRLSDEGLPPLTLDEGGDGFARSFRGHCYNCRKMGFGLWNFDKGALSATHKACGLTFARVQRDFDLLPPKLEAEPDPEPPPRASSSTDHVSSHILFAEEFAARAKGDWLQDDDAKKWWHWDGKRWREDTHKARALMMTAIRDATADDPKDAKKWRTASHVSGALSVASDLDGMSVRASQHFDRKANLLGLPTGRVLDLDSATVRDAERDDFITMSVAVEPEDGELENWLRFLDTTFEPFGDGKAQLIAALRGWLKDMLYGSVRCAHRDDHSFVFLQGDAGTGKSTLANVIKDMMGSYGRAVSGDRVVGDKDDHRQWLARLDRARMVVVSEPPRRVLKAEIINCLTSGDVIEANFMRQNSFDFSAVAHLIMYGNERPLTNSPGIYRRMRLLEMNTPPVEPDSELPAKLKAEQGRILRWILDSPNTDEHWPAEINAAVRQYELENDAVQQWLNERTVPSLGGKITSAAGYADYQQWAKDSGYKPFGKAAFSRQLGTHFIEVGRDRVDGRPQGTYRGIKLASDVPDGLDELEPPF